MTIQCFEYAFTIIYLLLVARNFKSTFYSYYFVLVLKHITLLVASLSLVRVNVHLQLTVFHKERFALH
jgi:hypothetical protein